MIVSVAVSSGLFALVYSVLPDVDLKARDVAIGALVTGVLFTGGQQLIGLYLGHSAATSSYGAAGSVILLLLWVYYSSQVVLLGAEFTRLHADHEGYYPPPVEFAEPDPDAAIKAT
jgi:membrane protein